VSPGLSSEWQDSNLRSPVSGTGGVTNLTYTQWSQLRDLNPVYVLTEDACDQEHLAG
jgi:hypothetical protein